MSESPWIERWTEPLVQPEPERKARRQKKILVRRVANGNGTP
jgi:hypothetical protein